MVTPRRLGVILVLAMCSARIASAQVVTIAQDELARLENANYPPSDPILLHAALLAFNAAQGADLASTMYAIGGGKGREANPAFAAFTQQPIAAGAIKMASSALLGYGIWRLHATHPKLAMSLALIGTSGYSLLALHNARIAR